MTEARRAPSCAELDPSSTQRTPFLGDSVQTWAILPPSTLDASISPSFLTVNTPASILTVSDLPPTVGEMVRPARTERGLSQDELAELVGKSQRWVSALENNEIKYPRRPVLQRLAFALRLDYFDLLIAAGEARNRAEAKRVAKMPDGNERTVGGRVDRIWPDLAPGERASIEAMLRAHERQRRKSR